MADWDSGRDKASTPSAYLLNMVIYRPQSSTVPPGTFGNGDRDSAWGLHSTTDRVEMTRNCNLRIACVQVVTRQGRETAANAHLCHE